MIKRTCKKQDCKDDNSNCPVPDFDGLPLQCVGSWVEDKYYCLSEKFIHMKYME